MNLKFSAARNRRSIPGVACALPLVPLLAVQTSGEISHFEAASVRLNKVPPPAYSPCEGLGLKRSRARSNARYQPFGILSLAQPGAPSNASRNPRDFRCPLFSADGLLLYGRSGGRSISTGREPANWPDIAGSFPDANTHA
jgi:hypothetical protein